VCSLSFSFSTRLSFLFFFLTDPGTTEIYTLSLHDALPISGVGRGLLSSPVKIREFARKGVRSIYTSPSSSRRHHAIVFGSRGDRSEEHTSELQSRRDLVCRLLLEKKK